MITDDLHLVLDVGAGYAYHTPISREVFNANYKLLAMTRADLESHGRDYQMGQGPLIAALTMADVDRTASQNAARFDAAGKPDESLSRAFFAELQRLTLITVPSDAGWTQVPVSSALSAKTIDAEDWEDVLSQLVFFTCHYALSPKKTRKTAAEALAALLTGSITSLLPTDWIASLTTSTPENSSTAVE